MMEWNGKATSRRRKAMLLGIKHPDDDEHSSRSPFIEAPCLPNPIARRRNGDDPERTRISLQILCKNMKFWVSGSIFVVCCDSYLVR